MDASWAIDVCMVCYNAQTFTMRAVESLLTRTHAPVHLWILDNGSTDGTGPWLDHVAARWPAWVTVWHQPMNLGAQAGKQWLLDHALPQASAPVLAIVDNDIEVWPDWDVPFLTWITTQPRVGICGAEGYRLSHPQGQREVWPVYPGAAPRPVDVVTGFLTVVSRAAWDAAGYRAAPIANGYWHHDDDWCLHLARAGYTQWVMPAVAVRHWGSRSSQLIPDQLTRAAQQANAAYFLRRWQDQGLVDAHGDPIRPQAVPQRPIIRWEGPILHTHSLAHVNRQALLAGQRALPEWQWIWRPVGPEGDPAAYEDGWALWSQRETWPVPAAVTIRHQWPPQAQRPTDGSLWVIMQPWEYQAVPDALARVLREADQVWAPSTYVCQLYEAAGVPAERLRWVPNGVDRARFTPDGPRWPVGDPDRVTLLYVGGLIPRKGYDLLWQAYTRAFGPDDPVQLVIRDVGTGTVYATGPIRQQLQQLSADPSLPRLIVIARDLSEPELAALYRTADVVVQPYRAEGFCLPLLEAMASGRPVIAPAGGGSGDFVTPDVGWLLPTRRVSRWTLGQLGYAPPDDTTPAPHDEPDLDALVDILRAAVDAVLSGQAAARGQAGRAASAAWTWERTAAAMRDALAALGVAPTVATAS